MLTEIDIIVFLFVALVWLGPFIYNILMGRGVRLIHPTGWFPLNVVWFLVPPLFFRWLGRPITQTAWKWSSDEWFLGVPMLIVGLTGLFYFLGVYVSGTSLKLNVRDRVEPYSSFRVVSSCHPAVMFVLCIIALAAATAFNVLGPKGTASMGFYWMQLLFFAVYTLPVVMLNQDLKLGTIFLVLCFPATLVLVSKGAFLFFLLQLAVYYQGKIFRMSKVVSVLLVLSVLLTPYAVWLYSQGGFSWNMDRVKATSWEMTGMTLMHRELAFEIFSIIYQKTNETIPPQTGNRIIGEVQEMIPAVLWPEKPNRGLEFAHEFMTDDFPVAFAPHLLTPFLLDLGIPGCCGIMFFMGLLYGVSYKKAVTLSLAKHESWPLIIYYIWCFGARALMNAGLGVAIPLSIAVTSVVAAILGASYLFRPGRSQSITHGLR
jgi:hypothetical protein